MAPPSEVRHVWRIAWPLGISTSRPFLSALGGAPETVVLAARYLNVVSLGSLFTMFNFGVTGVLLGVGRTRVSLALLLCVNTRNIVLNYVFIFAAGYLFAVILGLGFTGIAVALALSAVTRAIPTGAKFRQGRWKAIRI